MKVEIINGIQKISPCERDYNEASRREFELKGMLLISQLQSEIEQLKKTTKDKEN